MSNDNKYATKYATKYDVLGIGNAIVDVLTFAEDPTLTANGFAKGSMTLVEEDRALALYDQIGQTKECSGGSVANSLAGLASLGAKCSFIGKVKEDQLGKIFTHDMRSVGVDFNSAPLTQGKATATCLIYVTPDAQRTMATYIGACGLVSEEDINEEDIKNAQIVYIEGYLWDLDSAKDAIRKAVKLAEKADRKVAFTLSDTFCVNRHRDEFFKLIDKHVDILFANEDEIKALFETEDLNNALAKVQGICETVAITRGEKGSIAITKNSQQAVPTEAVENVVDTTGAGDLYASGFLFGLSRGWALPECAKLGNRCAGEIITQLGARSMQPLNKLVA